MTAPGAPALSESRCRRGLPFLSVSNQRIRYFGTRGGRSRRKSKPQSRRVSGAPRAHRVPVAPRSPPPTSLGTREGRGRRDVGCRPGRSGGRPKKGRGLEVGAEPKLLGRPPFPSVPWRGNLLPFLSLFSSLPSASVRLSGPAASRSPEAPACCPPPKGHRGPASSALGPANLSVFPKGNEGAQRLASLPARRRRSRGAA